MPPRLRQITIEGFRSVNDQIVINLDQINFLGSGLNLVHSVYGKTTH